MGLLVIASSTQPVLRLLGALILVGCASCSPKPKQFEIFNGAPLPKPDQVLVYDFAITPEDVDPSHGVSARTRNAAGGNPRTQKEIATGRSIAAALSKELVGKIQGMGINARRATYPVMPTGDDLALRGQFLTIQSGDPAHKVEIGLAGSRDQVHAEVQIYQNSLRVEQFEDVANHPGNLPPPSGSVAGFENDIEQQQASAAQMADAEPATAPVQRKPFGTDAEADASRVAAKLAKPLAAFFLREGWISGTPQ